MSNSNNNSNYNYNNKYQKNRQYYKNKSNESNNNNNNNNNNYENRKSRGGNNDSTRDSYSYGSYSNVNNNNENRKSDNQQQAFKERSKTQQQQQQNKADANQFSKSQKTSGNNNHTNSQQSSNYKSNHHQNQYQPAPFQPAIYHQHHHGLNNNQNKSANNNLKHNTGHHHHHHNHHHNNNQKQNGKILIEKYNRKYNLISFILLRKNDEYLKDNKFYLNDQSLYEQVDYLVENKDLISLRKLYMNVRDEDEKKMSEIDANESNQMVKLVNKQQRLSNFTNSYNCSLFVYTIRKLLENEYKLKNSKSIELFLNKNSKKLSDDDNDSDLSIKTNEFIEFLFSKNLRPSSFFLIDGEFPKRNLIHYAARYNRTKIVELILKSFNEDEEMMKEAGPDEEKHSSTNMSIQFNGEFVFAQLCMQMDFNGNTPIHLMAQNNSYEILTMTNQVCIKHSQLIYNEDGLNPFLLASRHSSIKFIDFLIQKASFDLDTIDSNLLCSKDKLYSKNCLHYACGRGCGKDALHVIKYLTGLAKKLDSSDINNNNNQIKSILFDLIGSISPLVGSIYHVAASNLTRLTSLWYLLNLYPKNGLFISFNSTNSPQKIENILDHLDFRDFTTVDCLIDSVMNLREMAPPSCKSLAQFYDFIMTQKRNEEVTTKFMENELIDSSEPSENSDTSSFTGDKSIEDNFDVLLKRCIYKLLVDFKAKLFNLPRIKNQLQLVEFMKIVVFMSKFVYTNRVQQNEKNSIVCSTEVVPVLVTSTFDSIYSQNFEAFCLNFFKEFIFGGDLLPPFFCKSDTATSTSSSSSSTTSSSNKNANKEANEQKNTTKQLNSKNNKNSKNKQNQQSSTCNQNNQENHHSTSSSSSSSARAPIDTCDEIENLYQILMHMHELTSIVILSGKQRYSESFQSKMFLHLKSYFVSFSDYLDSLRNQSLHSHLSASKSISSNSNNNSLSVFIESKLTSPLSSIIDSADDETLANSINNNNDNLNDINNNACSCISPKSQSSILSTSSYSSLLGMQSGVSSILYESLHKQHKLERTIKDIKIKLDDIDIKIDHLNMKKYPFSLKNLCRIGINNHLSSISSKKLNSQIMTNEISNYSQSLLSNKYVYFQIPETYHKLINYLTFYLIEDLHGHDFEIR